MPVPSGPPGAHVAGDPRRAIGAGVACIAFAVALYLAFVHAPQAGYHWGLQVSPAGTVLRVDPNFSATDSGVLPGDRVISAANSRGARLLLEDADTAAVVRVHHRGAPDIVLRAPRRPFAGEPIALVLALLASFFLLCGQVVWWRAIARPAALQLLALCTLIATTLVADIGGRMGDLVSTRFVGWSGGIYFPLLIASFFLTFPRNRLAGPRGRRVPMALVVAGALLTALYTATLTWWTGVYPVVHLLLFVVFVGGLVTAVGSLLRGYRADEERLRQQRRIVVGGVVGGFTPLVACSALPYVLTGVPLVPFEESILPFALLPLTFGYAILKYDLLRLDTVIRRAAVHSLFIATTLCVYLGVISGAGVVLARLWSGGGAGPPSAGASGALAVLAATLVVGVLLAPLRTLVQTAVERLLFPEIYRYNQLVREGGLPNEGTDLGVLADLLHTSVRMLLPVTTAQLFVRQEGDCYALCLPARRGPRSSPGTTADGTALLCSSVLTSALGRSAWGCAREDLAAERGLDGGILTALEAQGMSLLMPLRQTGVVTGFLAVGPRTDQQPFAGVDRELLALVAERYALAVDHAVLLGTLERQVRDISSLYAASAALTTALRASPDELPRHVAQAAASIAGVARVHLSLASGDPTVAVEHSAVAERNDEGVPAPRALAMASGTELPVDAWTDALFVSGNRPVARLPLRAGDRVLGALHLEMVGPARLGAEERRLLITFANQAAVALEHAQLYGQAVRHAEREPLTGLYNHRMITSFLESELVRARRAEQPLSVLIMDIRNFKLFNDTYGHLAGDQLLKRVAQVLEACCRQTDFAGRTGGDEFTVLLPRADHLQGRSIAERIHAMAASLPYEAPDGRQIPLELNIGVASFPDDGEAVNALLMAADERMYAAKRSGSAVQGLPNGEDAVSTGRFGVLESLVAAVDNKDSYTAKHSDQVARFAMLLAAEVGASQETLRTLRVAGLLHDVGKIGVPDRILRKPGRLTGEEQEIMQQHVQLSEMLLRTVSPSPDLLDAVRYHHERWDGRGYPYGLSGEAIPLLGRVMIVADAVSAMIMDRPYRKGLPWDAVCSELRRGAGAQFDPQLVEPFIRAADAAGMLAGDPSAA